MSYSLGWRCPVLAPYTNDIGAMVWPENSRGLCCARSPRIGALNGTPKSSKGTINSWKGQNFCGSASRHVDNWSMFNGSSPGLYSGTALGRPGEGSFVRHTADGETEIATYSWPDKQKPRICILGGGFGGLYTALRLESLLWPDEKKPQVLLVDQSDRLFSSQCFMSYYQEK